MMESPPPREPLPTDILLDIVARTDDVATVVRCAATFKLLRRAILNPGFVHRLQVRADPAFLVGVSYSSSVYGHDKLELNPSRRLRLDPRFFQYAYQPLSSRDGLLVLLGPESRREELHVCNSFTGVITTLPSMDVGPDNWENAIYYYPAILDVGRAGRDFEVLAMDQCLRTRIFSSSGGVGKWGAIRVAKAPPEYKSCGGIKQLVLHNSPAVVGRTVHWICHAKVGPAIEEEEMFVLALHADDAAQATAIEMPPGYPYIESTDMQTCTVQIAAVDGKLSVVMAESEVVSVSTRSPEGWIRQAVFRKREISRQVNGTRGFREVRFEGFGERSGTVLFWMDTVGLVRLSLDARKAVVVREYIERDRRGLRESRAWLHEINLGSLLSEMKIF